MAENNKIYITANELAEMLGVSVGHAYKLIRKLNQELEKEGFAKESIDTYLAMFAEVTPDVAGVRYIKEKLAGVLDAEYGFSA